MIGLGLAVLWPLMERRVVSAVTMEQTISLPVLAMVPLLKRANLTVGAQRLTVVEYLALRPLSLFAESLRSLRIGLRFGQEGMPRVVQVTSAVVGEGKSTIAASMAMSAAAAGVRTVLVDLDLYQSFGRRDLRPATVEGRRGRSGRTGPQQPRPADPRGTATHDCRCRLYDAAPAGCVGGWPVQELHRWAGKAV